MKDCIDEILIEVLLGNIINQNLDVIVNSANQSLFARSGILGSIHKEAQSL